MTTKYTYPPDCTTPRQKQKFRQKMRKGGKTPKPIRKPTTRMSGELGFPKVEQDDVFDASIIAALNSGDQVALHLGTGKKSSIVHICAQSTGKVLGLVMVGFKEYWKYTERGFIEARHKIANLDEILDRTFKRRPRSSNKEPFVYTAGMKARDLVAHLATMNNWMHPVEAPIIVDQAGAILHG